MYAMCNIHDVTWFVSNGISGFSCSDLTIRGTKGDNMAVKDLGSAIRVKDAFGRDVLELELPASLEEVDRLWDASRAALAFRLPRERPHRDPATRREDQDRNSRTNLVLAWIGTNMLVVTLLPPLLKGSRWFEQILNSRLHVQYVLGLGGRTRWELRWLQSHLGIPVLLDVRRITPHSNMLHKFLTVIVLGSLSLPFDFLAQSFTSHSSLLGCDSTPRISVIWRRWELIFIS